MKRTIIFLLTSLLLLFLCACAGKDGAGDSKNDRKEKPVLTEHEYSNENEDDLGESTSEQTSIDGKWKVVRADYYNHDGKKTGYDEYKYLEDCHIITHTTLNTNGEIDSREESKYDNNGQDVYYWMYDSSGAITEGYENTFEYDQNGNKTEGVRIDQNGDIDIWYSYEYDESGNLLVDHKEYRDHSDLNTTGTYEYDGLGNVIRITWTLNDGGIRDWYEYEYDQNGNCIELRYREPDGTLSGWETHEYYSDGIRKKMTYETPGGSGYFEEYYEDGRIYRTIRYDENGNTRDGQEYEYNSFGLGTKYTRINQDGSKTTRTTVYEFDENGTPCRSVTYDDQQNSNGWTEIQCDFIPYDCLQFEL